MALQLDKSLYTKLNEETQIALNNVNYEAEKRIPIIYNHAWGFATTLRKKILLLNKHIEGPFLFSEYLKEAKKKTKTLSKEWLNKNSELNSTVIQNFDGSLDEKIEKLKIELGKIKKYK